MVTMDLLADLEISALPAGLDAVEDRRQLATPVNGTCKHLVPSFLPSATFGRLQFEQRPEVDASRLTMFARVDPLRRDRVVAVGINPPARWAATWNGDELTHGAIGHWLGQRVHVQSLGRPVAYRVGCVVRHLWNGRHIIALNLPSDWPGAYPLVLVPRHRELHDGPDIGCKHKSPIAHAVPMNPKPKTVDTDNETRVEPSRNRDDSKATGVDQMIVAVS